MRNFERPWRKIVEIACASGKNLWNKRPSCRYRVGNGTRPHGFDSNRDTILLFNLANGDAAVGAVHDTFYQATLRVSRFVSELRHIVGNYRDAATQ